MLPIIKDVHKFPGDENHFLKKMSIGYLNKEYKTNCEFENVMWRMNRKNLSRLTIEKYGELLF